MKITKQAFGKDHLDRAVTEYTLTNASGASVSVLDLGGTISKIMMPDRSGHLDDVVLGYDDALTYMQSGGYLGALIGRHGNRIGGASFTLDGHFYQLAGNDRGNNLHGGPEGFDRRIFGVQETEDALVLTLTSPDGDQGYPGTLQLQASYALSDAGELSITYRATTDRTTIVNLTNHSYFNLDGQGSGTVEDLVLEVYADTVTDTDDALIPTGEFLPAASLVYGFQAPTRIGDVLGKADAVMKSAGGVDFNYCAGKDREDKLIATLYSPKTGREMQVITDLPGVQVYTGQGLSQPGKGGVQYKPYFGVCLETQRYPDAIHHPHFPSIVLRPGEVYLSKTAYRFAVR